MAKFRVSDSTGIGKNLITIGRRVGAGVVVAVVVVVVVVVGIVVVVVGGAGLVTGFAKEENMYTYWRFLRLASIFLVENQE